MSDMVFTYDFRNLWGHSMDMPTKRGQIVIAISHLQLTHPVVLAYNKPINISVSLDDGMLKANT